MGKPSFFFLKFEKFILLCYFLSFILLSLMFFSVSSSLRISWVPHLSLLKYQTALSPFLLTFLSAVLLNSQPLTSISRISAIPLVHSTPFLKSPVNCQCKKKKTHTYFFLYSAEKSRALPAHYKGPHISPVLCCQHIPGNLSNLSNLQISITNCFMSFVAVWLSN